MKIPSMGGKEIGLELREFASNCEPGTSIVEIGVWMGAGTQYLKSGAHIDVIIRCYDRFEANNIESEKLKKYGYDVEPGQDTLPIIKDLFLQDWQNIIFHKGNIFDATYPGDPISLYVDDMCKREDKFRFAINLFSPHWIPGETIIIFMDYLWHLKHLQEDSAQIQPVFLQNNRKCFEFVKHFHGKSCIALRYMGGGLII